MADSLLNHPLNYRVDDAIKQLREMKLSPEELEKIVDRYADATTRAELVIHIAATLLCLEIAFGRQSNETAKPA